MQLIVAKKFLSIHSFYNEQIMLNIKLDDLRVHILRLREEKKPEMYEGGNVVSGKLTEEN